VLGGFINSLGNLTMGSTAQLMSLILDAMAMAYKQAYDLKPVSLFVNQLAGFDNKHQNNPVLKCRVDW